MRVKTLRIQGFRSFIDSGPIPLKQINVLIGANNSGKSTILRSLYTIQEGADVHSREIRVHQNSSTIEIELEPPEIDELNVKRVWSNFSGGSIIVDIASGVANAPISMKLANTPQHSLNKFPASEPGHFIVPFLSKRKTMNYQEDVRSQFAMQVLPTMQYLAAKLSRISNPEFPGHERYRKACQEILGFVVTGISSEAGQRPGIYLPDKNSVSIDFMGDGVPNIVNLLADLALSERKLFLIEELENDLHPTALKALLDLIVESSKSNQFVISTHSNIVLRHLGAAEESLVYQVRSVPGKLPTEALITAVEPTPRARLEVLRDLGYSFSDFDLWDGWLILEESSAERIIRDYLIPWFAPKLSRVRTLSTGGNGQVEPSFDDFHRLARFTHLETIYAGSAWVRIDGDHEGKKIVGRLREKYPTWQSDRFATYSSTQFESYFPGEFQVKVKEVLAIPDRQRRKQAKLQLLEEVRTWLDSDEDRARKELLISAKEIIDDLRKIERQLKRADQQ